MKSGLGGLTHSGNAQGDDLTSHLTRALGRHRLGRENLNEGYVGDHFARRGPDSSPGGLLQ